MSAAMTIEELADLITDDAGENVIGQHIWVEDMESGLLYAAITDMDAEGIVAIWSIDGVYREVDYGRTWVAYSEFPVDKVGHKPFLDGVEFDDSDDEDDEELIDLAKERLARFYRNTPRG